MNSLPEGYNTPIIGVVTMQYKSGRRKGKWRACTSKYYRVSDNAFMKSEEGNTELEAVFNLGISLGKKFVQSEMQDIARVILGKKYK